MVEHIRFPSPSPSTKPKHNTHKHVCVHVSMQVLLIDLTSMPVSGTVSFASFAGYSKVVNDGFGSARCYIAAADVCAYNMRDGTKVCAATRSQPLDLDPTMCACFTMMTFMYPEQHARQQNTIFFIVHPTPSPLQIGCVTTDSDGGWSMGITVGTSIKVNVTKGGGQGAEAS